MSTRQQEIDWSTYVANRPQYEQKAEKILSSFAKLSVDELHDCLKLSATLCRKFVEQAYDFSNKSLGYTAMDGFTGVVFRYIEPRSLNDAEMEFAQSHLRIISSLYGILRPADIIKPYRFDFTSPADPDNATPLARTWKKDNTVAIVKLLQETGQKEIVNLLPVDASRSIDWKVIRRYAKVYHIEFKQIGAMGKLTTPPATKLKEMRGRLTRQILMTRTDSIDALRQITSDHYAYAGDLTYPDTLTFLI